MGRALAEKIGPESTWTGLARSLRKVLLCPAAIAYFVSALTIDIWAPWAIYLLLRTWLLGWGSFFMWAVVFVSAFLFLAGIAHAIVRSVSLGPLRRAWREAVRSGDEDARARAFETWRSEWHRMKLWPVFVAMFALLTLVPSTVAVVLCTSDMPGLVRVHGRYRRLTHDEQMRKLIRAIEVDGPSKALRT